MNRFAGTLVAAVFALALVSASATAQPFPLSSAITYQGVLKSGGAAYNGTADFVFKLYDSPGGVTQIGGAIAHNGVVVVDGAFTVSLDFGPGAYNGEERWLQIEAHTPSNGGVPPFSTLTPRQRLAAAPYALRALNANISGLQPNAVNFSNAANAFNGSGAGLTSLNAANITAGNLAMPRMPTGGVWSVTSPTTISGQTFGSLMTIDNIEDDPSSTLSVTTATNSGAAIVATAHQQSASAITAQNSHPNGYGLTVFAPRNYFGGRVGIGTFSPDDNLVVVGTGTAIATVDGAVRTRLFSSSSSGRGYVGSSGGYPFTIRSNDQDRINIDLSGRVLVNSIQAGPSLMGLVNGDDQASGMTLTTPYRTWFVGQNRPADNTGLLDSYYIRDTDANATRMVINTAGNVGIGTFFPGTRLHVVTDDAAMNALQAVNSAGNGLGVASGVVGITAQSNVNAAGVKGFNLNDSGTGVIGVGNNRAPSAQASGSGGAFTGLFTGVYARSDNAALGEGLASNQFGDVDYVGHYDGSTFYKIVGVGTVSTVVPDANEQMVTMFAPESPEVLFQDFGDGMLINGFAHIDLDPSFAKNVLIDAAHPMRVFIQLEDNENCQGVIVRNKSATGFDVIELRGGTSNTPFQYQITCSRADQVLPSGRLSRYADLRFPPAPAPREVLTGAADQLTVGQAQTAAHVRPAIEQ